MKKASSSESREAFVLSIGNTNILCALTNGTRILRTYRLPSTARRLPSSVLRLLSSVYRSAALCSVVPALTSSVARRFPRTHILTATNAPGLKIRYRNPSTLGTDRIACALGARALYPKSNVIIVDCGTATTVTAVDKYGILHGGAILPGVALWPEILSRRTAQLPRTKLRIPRSPVGRSPQESIESGIYYGHVGAIREIISQLQRKLFPNGKTIVLGTGGNAPLFSRENLFTKIEPRLILTGLIHFARSTDDA